ncbi:hypothetical protein OIDMADRAFT_19812 [Oidiodendron maius Zn]|uniref:Xylanolytic transcriptional activator regulatory domain-containing protein n=1 Tax=Oidiodendron maius (strain Zn) TaxID=913774 RepID=A0A0C3H9H0_OIDMZ|nr:hypothetical protein OIDMADRAFT_19812 [Oidiodendron maius Zn]
MAIIDNNVEGFLVELTERYKCTLSESCRAYFTAVNCWIPIIQQSAFESRLQESSIGMDSDFALLVLSCLLLSKAASQESDKAELRTIYQIVRAYLFLFHSSGSQTLEIVQAGLVVTIFEHMQAEWENSFETIEKTAQLFCNTTIPLSIVTSRDAVSPTTTLLNSRVWWAIFIVERLVKSILGGDGAAKLKFVCKMPELSVLLPLEDENVCINSFPEMMPLSKIFTSLEASEPVMSLLCAVDSNHSRHGYFSRLAQAVCLLDIVLRYVSSRTSDSQQYSIISTTIREFALSVLHERAMGNCKNCSVLGICVSASIILSDYEMRSLGPYLSTDNMELYVQAKNSLQSSMQLVFDRMAEFPSWHKQYSSTPPVWSLHASFLGALMYERWNYSTKFQGHGQEYFGSLLAMLECHREWKLTEYFIQYLSLVLT